jgi:hypothetical protein
VEEGSGRSTKRLKPPGRTASLLLPHVVGELHKGCIAALPFASSRQSATGPTPGSHSYLVYLAAERKACLAHQCSPAG